MIFLQPSELYLSSTLLITQDLQGKLSKLNIITLVVSVNVRDFWAHYVSEM